MTELGFKPRFIWLKSPHSYPGCSLTVLCHAWGAGSTSSLPRIPDDAHVSQTWASPALATPPGPPCLSLPGLLWVHTGGCHSLFEPSHDPLHFSDRGKLAEPLLTPPHSSQHAVLSLAHFGKTLHPTGPPQLHDSSDIYINWFFSKD